MATLDVNTETDQGSAAAARAQPAVVCEAHDLKRIMTQIADQIADADRRHGQALKAMQERLGIMETSTRDVREHVPREKSGALDRIEERMAELSDTISGASPQRRPAGGQAPAALPVAEPAPALRSALAGEALNTFALRVRTSAATSNAAIDKFDVVDTAPPGHDAGHDEGAVSAEAADALARLYEAGVADPDGAPVLDAVTAAEKPQEVAAHESAFTPAPPAPPSETPVAVEASHNDADRQWLEERFAEVASRLEQSLSGIGPDRSIETIEVIEERFSALENKLSDAIAQPGRSPDLSALASIESQVEDLNAQLVAVQTHFSRLDTIELELRSLAERMSEDELSRLFQMNAPKESTKDPMSGEAMTGLVAQQQRMENTLQSIAAQLSADKIATLVASARGASPDASSIARLVADEVAQRMPAQPAGRHDHGLGIDELRSTIEAFVAERRHTDEQTNTMLDTMQQAMIRLLDRMEAFEQSQYAAHEEGGDAASDYGRQPAMQSEARQPEPMPVNEPHHRYEARETAMPKAVQEPVTQSQVPESANMAFTSEPPKPELRPPATPISASSLRASVQQPPSGPVSQAEPELPPPAQTRENFVAAARRAAKLAADAPPEQEVSAEAPAPAQPARAAAKSSGTKLSPLALGLAFLILVGASFVAVKSTILAPKAPEAAAPQAQTQAPAGSPRVAPEKRIQNLEDADGPGGRPGDAQRRSSVDGLQGEERDAIGRPANGGVAPIVQGAPTVPAALTRDADIGAAAPRSNELPPLSIGPNSLRSAAAKGEPSAEFEIGARFAEGRGVPQDLQQAVSWYQRAASQGYAPAQYRLGSMFERGLGVKADLARARVWYQRAAEQGIVKAMHNLAVLTAGRDTALTDYTTAGKWFQAAADHGLTDSQFNLAIMFDSGLGVDRDAKQAFKWFSLAARSGDEEASRRRDSLRHRLQPQEVAAVEAEIASWRPKPADQNVNDPRLAGEAWKSRTR